MTDNENLSLRMLRPVICPLLQSMDDAINDIRDREELGWKAEEVQEVKL